MELADTTQPARILFCDYDGEFESASTLTRLGFLVDQIRPDALRSVTVGDHSVYVFTFGDQANTKNVLKTCEKLKAAELLTPIVIVNRDVTASPEFLNHRSHARAADAYVANSESESALLDTLDEITGAPLPPDIRLSTGSQRAPNPEILEKLQLAENKVMELEKNLVKLEDNVSSKDKALEAQRQHFTPKLKALLEGQKLKVQSETEMLKVRLSEVEAKLLDREARVKELSQARKNQKKKLEALVASHQKAQDSLRGFYQQKIKKLSAVEAVSDDTDEIKRVSEAPEGSE